MTGMPRSRCAALNELWPGWSRRASSRRCPLGGHPLALFDGDVPVDRHVAEHLLLAARPETLEGIDLSIRTQSEQDPWILRRAVAKAPLSLVVADKGARLQLQPRTGPVADAPGAD